MNPPHDNQDGYDGYGGFGDGSGAGFATEFGADHTAGLELPPWERREQFGFLNAAYLTTRGALLSPQKFFHRMPSRIGLTQPLLFALILGVLGAFFGWLWSMAGSSLQVLVADDLPSAFRGPLYSFVAFVMSPATVIVLLFARAALYHLMLMLVGGNKLGFEATFRVAAYGEAAGVVAMLPFCGSLLGVAWGLVINIVGLYSIHGTDPWRAMVAVLAPLLLCTSTIGAAILLFVLGMQ